MVKSATVPTETRPRAPEGGAQRGEGRGSQGGVETEAPDRLRKGSEHSGVPADTLPYLSIGVNPGEAPQQPANQRGPRSTQGQGMRRILTWPPAAAELQARRKQLPEKEGGDVLDDVWPLGGAVEAEKTHRSRRHLEETEADGIDEGRVDDPPPGVRPPHVPNPPEEGAAVDLGETGGSAPAAKPEKAPRRKEATAAGKRGVTPNDETLLSGNEYVFVDLLHEVVQNKGRWTRERWRQTHASKPGRKERGADAHLK